MKRVFVGLLIAGVLIAGSSYWWVIQGPWLDQATSLLVSKKCHVSVHIKNVRVLRWSNIRFDSLVVVSGRGEQWINTGRGEIEFDPLSFLSKPPPVVRVHLERVIVLRDFYKEGLAISFIPPKWLETSSVIDEVRLRVSKNELLTSIRILQVRSPSVGLRGGIQFEGKQIVKMNLFISASEEALRRLPGMLRSRLFGISGGWQGARIVYCKNTVTAIGHSGPFFKFRWQPT